MQARITNLAAVLFCFMLLPSADGAALTGRQIVDKAADAHEASAELELQSMTLLSGDKVEEQREVRRYAIKEGKDEWKYLVSFLSPAGVKGVALLTWSHAGGQDDQWLYLPSLGNKLTRVAKGSRKDYFMGTDLAYEDMVTEDRNNHTYTLKGEEALDGAAHYVVEAVPAKEEFLRDSGYSRRIVWIRMDNFFIARTDFYDKRERLMKRQLASKLAPVKGAMWRAQRVEVEHFLKKHKTVVDVKQRSFDAAAVPASVFTHRFILEGSHAR
jgi:hypothetical protein